MSRFYKPAGPKFVDDIIFKLPYQEMAQVLAKKDADIDQMYKEIGEFKKQLDVDNLAVDDPEINESILGFQNNIKDMQTRLAEDYSRYGELLPQMKNMSIDLDNAARGKYKAAKQNKIDYNNWSANSVDKLKNVDAKVKEGLKKAQLDRYAQVGGLSYSDATRSHNRISDMLISTVDGFDLNTFTNQIAQGFKADSDAYSKQEKSKRPFYFKNTSGSITELTPKEVKAYADTALDSTTWEASTLQELQYGEGLSEEEALARLPQEKQQVLDAIAKKVAFKKKTSASSFSPDTLGYRMSKDSEGAGQALAVPTSKAPEVKPQAGLIRQVNNSLDYGKQKSNYEQYQKDYEAGKKKAKDIFGSNFGQLANIEGVRNFQKFSRQDPQFSKDLSNLEVAERATLNIAMRQHPTETTIQFDSKERATGLTPAFLAEQITNNATQMGYGEVQITGSRGLLGTYENAGSPYAAFAMAGDQYMEEAQVIEKEVTVRDEVTDMPVKKTVKEVIQAGALSNDVIRKAVKSGKITFSRAEYGVIDPSTNTLETTSDIIMKIPVDINPQKGETQMVTIEYRIPESKLRNTQQ